MSKLSMWSQTEMPAIFYELLWCPFKQCIFLFPQIIQNPAVEIVGADYHFRCDRLCLLCFLVVLSLAYLSTDAQEQNP